MNLSATVLHNVSRDMFFRFDPETSELFHAHTFQIVADNIETAANLIWTLTNVDGSRHLHEVRPDLGQYGQEVERYRRRKNRSLSVSDVLIFHEVVGRERRFAGSVVVAQIGFETVTCPIHVDGSNDSEVSESYLAHRRFQAAFDAGEVK